MGQAGSAVMKGWVLGTLRTAGLVLSRRDVSALLGWVAGEGAAQGDPSHHPHPLSCLPAKEGHVPRMFAGFIPPGHLPRFL